MQTTTFGTFKGQTVHLHTLRNADGMEVKLSDYGAAVTSISLPDGSGGRREIVAGFDSLDGYFSESYTSNAPYFGCTVGRYASRIKDGKFSIDGQDYTVDVNDGSNHLHGGVDALDKRVWKAEKKGDNAVRFSLRSPDGDGGYPGNLDVSVTYTLTDDNELVMDYAGTTDKATPLSMTNHAYFNLSGFTETIHNHRARIDADAFLQPDGTNVPVGKETSVEGHFTDLRSPTRLGDRLDQTETGFETYYRFDGPSQTAREVARFEHPDGGVALTVKTTEPGALFYTGYFTSDELRRENGDQFGRYRAFCFEASRFPNGPNLKGVTNAVTRPGEAYGSRTIYELAF